jgi:hypothetical protein
MARCDLSPSASNSAAAVSMQSAVSLQPAVFDASAIQVAAVVDGLQLLKQLAQQKPALATALRSTGSTQEAAQLASEYGVAVTPEALWRSRGTLVDGGIPTWRG